MGKKIPIILLLALITTVCSGVLSKAPVYASEYNAEWGELWSIEEAKDFYYEVEFEKDQVCGADIDCRREYNYNYMFESPKHAIAEIYSMTSFMITAVNPAENSIKAYFRDLDNMAMEIDGEEKHYPLNELYILWLDSDYDRYGISYIDAFRGDFLVPGMHPLYQATTESNGENWFPVESEVEIIAPDADIIQNDSNMIEYYARFSPSSVLGLNNYSSCFQSNDYELGMECRVMFKGDGSYIYVPFEKNAESEEEDVDRYGGERSPYSDDENEGVQEENSSSFGVATIITPLTPDTGKAPKDEVNNDIFDITIVPWWPVIITMAICAAPIIWFLLPNRHNNRKISKKSLDKKEQTR